MALRISGWRSRSAACAVVAVAASAHINRRQLRIAASLFVILILLHSLSGMGETTRWPEFRGRDNLTRGATERPHRVRGGGRVLGRAARRKGRRIYPRKGHGQVRAACGSGRAVAATTRAFIARHARPLPQAALTFVRLRGEIFSSFFLPTHPSFLLLCFFF